MGYPTPERRERMKGAQPGTAPTGTAGASSARRSDEQHDRADNPAPASCCTTQPAPGTYLTLAALVAPCPDCGHATVLHIGVDHCPVCELAALNEQAREGLTQGCIEITVQGEVVTDQYLTALLERQALRYGRTRAFGSFKR